MAKKLKVGNTIRGYRITKVFGPGGGWVFQLTPLDDGTRVLIRPIRSDDKRLLQEGIQHLSPRSRYLRFLHYLEQLTPAELRYLTEIDYQNHFAWVALSLDQPDQIGLGVARYIRATADRELGSVVRTRPHGRGSGASGNASSIR